MSRRQRIGVIVLLLLGLWPAPPATVVAAPPYRVERTQTVPVTGDAAMVLSDGQLLWQETTAFGAARLSGLNLRTSRRLPLPATNTSQVQPALAGPLAAWIEPEERSDRPQVVVYDLESHRRQVVSGPEAVPDYPAIDDLTVVWRDRRGGGWHLYGYNLIEGQEFLIASHDQSQGPPVLSGRHVVWERYIDGSWDLAAYDLLTRRQWALVAGPGDQVNPRIDHGRIVFEERPASGGPTVLKLLTINSGAVQTIASGTLVTAPALAGSLVVWEDWRDGIAGIFAYDLARQIELPVTRSEQARRPVVDGQTLAWLNQSTSGATITLATLRSIRPTDRRDAPLQADPNVLYFAETGHTLGYGFKSFWQQHGGLRVFGYPLTEEFVERDPATGRERTVQYFERFQLEYDPAETDPARQVKVARLGSQVLAGRPGERAAPVEDTTDRRYFPESGQAIEGRFKQFWDQNDGFRLLGLPLTSDFEENGRTVQYFERGRLELVTPSDGGRAQPEPGLLGRETLVALGWLPGGSPEPAPPPRPLR